MNKILLIIQREYLTKVRKRSFIVMTMLGPILMAAMFILPVYLATRQSEKLTVTVLDQTGLFVNKLVSNDNYTFKPVYTDFEPTKDTLRKKGNYVLLYIPQAKLNVPSSAVIYSDKQPSLDLKDYVRDIMRRELEKQKLGAEIRKEILKVNPGYIAKADTTAEDLMSQTILKNIQTDVKISTIKTDETGQEKKSYTEVSMIVGIVASVMIYMFIFMFGAMVMRGVIEEKTNRIIEVIVSSVKPFPLMMGKIIGVALVGLTQFLLWVVFTFLIITAVQTAFPQQFKKVQTEQAAMNQNKLIPNEAAQAVTADQAKDTPEINQALEAISSINLPVMIIAFIFYFLFGYLLYGALFAAVGAAVDNETDTQQFMMPITIPLIFGLLMAQTVIRNPAGPLAYWLSIIPFTSPIIMLVRIPFGVPTMDLILSAVLLVLAFLGATWLAAKIYRVGILMYGKKTNWAELWKWIRYKE